MSFTKAEVEHITKLAVDMSNDAALACRFAEYMLKRFPREALRFRSPVPQPYEIEPGMIVTPRVQEWMHNNLHNYGSNFSMKIDAIRALRAQFGLGLREAKLTVEAYPFKAQ